jgi:hypothetical protein
LYFVQGDLDKIAQLHGTDKSSRGHNFMRFYEFFFDRLRNATFTLLELGVGPQQNKGKSLLTWRDYFPNATIVGVDIRPDAKELESGNVKVEIGDCANLDFLYYLKGKYQPAIIVDDASHRWTHQILCFEILFKSLARSGIYIVEDLNTSFEPLRSNKEYADSWQDGFSYFARLTYLVAGTGDDHPGLADAPPNAMMIALAREIDAISFFRRVALVIKK